MNDDNDDDGGGCKEDGGYPAGNAGNGAGRLHAIRHTLLGKIFLFR